MKLNELPATDKLICVLLYLVLGNISQRFTDSKARVSERSNYALSHEISARGWFISLRRRYATRMTLLFLERFDGLKRKLVCGIPVQRKLFYSGLETIRVIIRLENRYYCCPYCWLPKKKFLLKLSLGYFESILVLPLSFGEQIVVIVIDSNLRFSLKEQLFHKK